MSKRAFEKLVKLMTKLRSKDGCPWDKAQSHASIKKHLIEEAYEVCDAMDSKNPERFKDELGDLFFQVIFHAQIAKERGKFDINDVLRASYEKMVRRHPHVFGRQRANGPEEAYKRWQEKKDRENNDKGEKTLLKGVPKSLPALIKAQKISRAASLLGFEWPDVKGILKKIGEELKEIKNTLNYKNKHRTSEEIGDLLFAIVNLARFKGIDAEDTLNKATKKFVKRVKKIEMALKKRGKKIDDCSLKELDRLWEKFKA